MRTSVNGSIPLCSLFTAKRISEALARASLWCDKLDTDHCLLPLLWQYSGNKATRMLGAAEFAQVLERMLVHIVALNIQCLARCQDSCGLE